MAISTIAAVVLLVAQLAPAPLQISDQATYIDPTGARWCVTVVSIDPVGPGGVPYAWATVDPDPRRLVRAPAADLARACK